MKSFSAIEAIKFGWGVAKQRWSLFLAIFAVSFALGILGAIPDMAFGKDSEVSALLNLILFIPLFIINLMLTVGTTKIPIMLTDGLEVKFSDVWVKDWKLLGKYMLSGSLLALIVGAGFILLIIPGIIFSLRLMFTPYFVVDKGLGPIPALKASWNATKGNMRELMFLGLLNLLVVLAGLLALVVGLAVAIPTVVIAGAYAYRKLTAGVIATSPATPQVQQSVASPTTYPSV